MAASKLNTQTGQTDSQKIFYEKFNLQAILDRFNLSAFASMIEANTSFNFSIEKATYLEDRKKGGTVKKFKNGNLHFFNNKNKLSLQNGNVVSVAKELLSLVEITKDNIEQLCDFLAKYAHIDRSVYVEVKEYTSKRNLSQSKSSKPKSEHSPKAAKKQKIAYDKGRIIPFFNDLNYTKKDNTLPCGKKAICGDENESAVFEYVDFEYNENGVCGLKEMRVISYGKDIAFTRRRNSPIEIEKAKVRAAKRGKKFELRKYESPKIDGLAVGVRAYFTPLYQTQFNPQTKRFEANFKKLLALGEGEYKTLSVNLLGVPMVGLGGINSGTVIRNEEGLTRKEFKAKHKDDFRKRFEAVTADFLPEIVRFIKAHKPEKLAFIVDNDFLENEGKDTRAKAFISSFKWLSYAAEKHNISLEIAYPNLDQSEKGIDDLIFANIDQKEVIKNELEAVVPSNAYLGEVVGQFITKRLIHDRAEPLQTTFRLSNLIGRVKRSIEKTIKSEKYLCENREQTQFIYDTFRGVETDKPLGMYVPTGSGKNETAYNYIHHEKRIKGVKDKFAVLYPSNFSNEAKTYEYSHKENNFSELELKIQPFDQNTDKLERANFDAIFPSVDAANICFPSFLAVSELINEDDTIFVDEIHKIITNNNITRSETVNAIMHTPCKKIFLTGTDFESFNKEYNIDVVRFERKINPQIKVKSYIIENENLHQRKIEQAKDKLKRLKKVEGLEGEELEAQNAKIEKAKNKVDRLEKGGQNLTNEQALSHYVTVAKTLIESTDSQENKVHFVYMNNKEAILKQLIPYAIEKGFDTDYIFGGGNKSKAEKTESWKALTSSEEIPIYGNYSDLETKKTHYKSKIVFMTSVAYESVNIVNENAGIFAIFGESWIENIRQALGRLRKKSSFEVLYFRCADYQKRGFGDTYQAHRKRWFNSFKEAEKKLNGFSPMELLTMKDKDISKRNLLNDVSAVINNDMSFNRFGCVSAFENKRADQETNDQKLRRLAEFHHVEKQAIDISRIAEIFDTEANTAAILEDVKAYQNERKQDKRIATIQAKELFQDNTVHALALAAESSHSPKFKSEIFKVIGESVIESSDFENRKDEKRIEGIEVSELSRVEKQSLNRYVNKFLSVASKVEVVTVENIEQVGEHITDRNLAKLLPKQLDIVSLLESPNNTFDSPRDYLNKKVYEALIDKFEVGKEYTNEAIKTTVGEVYSKFEHKRCQNELTLIDCLFDADQKRITENGKRSKGRLLKKRIDTNYIAENYGLDCKVSADRSKLIANKEMDFLAKITSEVLQAA